LGAKNPFGIGFKESNRYKQSHKALRDAKTKYSVDNAVVSGHSLGHAVASGISSKNDKVITLDGAYTLGQKTRPNTTHYRTQGDLNSTFSCQPRGKVTGHTTIAHYLNLIFNFGGHFRGFHNRFHNRVK